jgi:NADPH:quinone reductase-like Zn-dependent oxidoreductase
LRPAAARSKMCRVRAAVLFEHGAAPRPEDFDDPPDADDCVLVDVRAAGLHHLDLHKASGTFYMGPSELPRVVGTDGVGPLPGAVLDVAEGVDDAVAAALGNTGLGGYLALGWRAGLRAGDTVLVLGATGAVGSVAVQVAKLLGAGRVVAAALADDRLQGLLDRGADAIVELDAVEDLPGAFRDAAEGDVDVTIDTLWGAPALAAMEAAGRWARHVEVGNLAGLEITLPAPLIRSKSLDLRGFNVAHPPLDVRREAYLRITELAARGELAVDVERVPLDDVAGAWERQRRAAGGPKLVVVPTMKGRASP